MSRTYSSETIIKCHECILIWLVRDAVRHQHNCCTTAAQAAIRERRVIGETCALESRIVCIEYSQLQSVFKYIAIKREFRVICELWGRIHVHGKSCDQIDDYMLYNTNHTKLDVAVSMIAKMCVCDAYRNVTADCGHISNRL